MPSPFPGMNPDLEHPAIWHGFHERLVPRMADVLESQVGPGYIVTLEEHVYVEEVENGESRTYLRQADVSVSEHFGTSTSSAGAAVLEAPVQAVPVLVEKLRECFIEIRDRRNRSLITVIELLSPANKSGSDRRQYLSKRDQLLKSPAHFVEIDLLRGGQRMPFEDLPACDYYVMVSREQQRPFAGIWPIGLRDPLPPIPIPLKPGDPDARLDLQQLLHEVHDAAGYAKYIYENDLTPPLAEEDAQWVKGLVS